MNKIEFNTKIWEYYLILENQFIDTFQYVEPGPINDTKNINAYTFSKVYNQLLLSIGSEIDILLKELCKLNGSTNVKIMPEYIEILKNYKDFPNEGCKYIYDDDVIYPFKSFNEGEAPQWWKDYNHLKHERLKDEYFVLGNYINVTQSLAALFIICRKLYSEYFEYEPTLKSRIFKMYNCPEYLMYGDEVLFFTDGENE